MLATNRNSWYTVSRMKQGRQTVGLPEGASSDVSEIWETFDSLFKTVHRQGRRVAELEARVAELERRLSERAVAAPRAVERQASEMPAERAA
ncbi:MAG: hypothetical protein LC672_01860 [Acidobacteria bacterium]|nr:hypothetical protein [Acidobacteriota bacterium]